MQDLKIEQYVSLILAGKVEAGTMKITKRGGLYEEMDERLQQLIVNFHIYPGNEYFQRARALFNF